MTWRSEIAPLLRRALEDTQGLPYRERRKRLKELYPLEESWGRVPTYRQRVWNDEARKLLGHKKPRKGLKERGAEGSLFGE